MEGSAKQHFIESYFGAFGQRIDRLQQIRKPFPDEAFTLCLVYIDRLASGHFGGNAGLNRRNFSRALKELSGNPLFGMIHPRQVMRRARHDFPSAVPIIRSVINRQRNTLVLEDELASEIRKSTLLETDKTKLVENLWRASIANIVYDHIRVAEVHGPGSGGLSFDKTVYAGNTGVTLDFDMFYNALGQILEKVRKVSMATGQWFGNPDYMRERC
ncbi:MAG: hypothetical protein CXZ00_09515 [Acidobacteria bacterium]|nr:MAG: hypothetical protein CXZ00_09515 [Acidobacteriota bacterium]